jgi:hypothetical protein
LLVLVEYHKHADFGIQRGEGDDAPLEGVSECVGLARDREVGARHLSMMPRTEFYPGLRRRNDVTQSTATAPAHNFEGERYC